MKKYSYHFIEKESDVTIISESKKAIKFAIKSFFRHRIILEKFVYKNEMFLKALSPIKVENPPEIIKIMVEYSTICDVGPMATVAGALADLMVEEMKKNKVISPLKIAVVENGGEISIDSEIPIKIGLYAGKNLLGGKLGFLITERESPLGIGSSSAKIGHALSFGESDIVTIFAKNATLADGAATKIANTVKGPDIEKSIKNGLDIVEDIDGVFGALISRDDKVGQVGKIPKFIKIIGKEYTLLKKKLEDFFPNYEFFH
jgi:ApbE superfamily uncharacterized protein (UPF0280 family)